MKIKRLDLLAFGPFTGSSLDLGHEGNGLHLIYGPNEAGKSSALRAIRAWLFGIPSNARHDAFVHDYKAMRLGGALENAAGHTLEFLRRKASKNSLLSPVDNGPLAANALDPFVGGMDAALFERVWGIDHAKLIEGGEDLRALKGLAGESLFAASMGVSGLSQVLSDLDREGRAIFVPDRRSKSVVGELTKQYEAATKRRREREVSIGAWDKLQKDLKRTRQQQKEVREHLNKQRAESNRLQRFLVALEDIGQRKATAEALKTDESMVLPAAYSADERRNANSTLHNIAEQLSAAETKLDSPGGLVARCAALKVDERVLAEAAAIGQLPKKSGAYQEAIDDLPKRRTEQRLLREGAERLLQEIQPGLDWERSEDLRLTQTLEAEVERLGQQQGRLQQSRIGIDEQLWEVQAELARVDSALADLPAARDVASLARAVTEASQLGDVQRQLTDAATEAARLGGEATLALQRLGHWRGTIDEVESLQLPLRGTLEIYKEQFRALQDDDAQLRARIQECDVEVSRIEARIAATQLQVEIPSRAALQEQREKREAGWQLVRRAWLGEAAGAGAGVNEVAAFAGDAPLQDAYERAVVGADATADRLIDHSELSATLEQLREQAKQQRDMLQKLGGRQEANIPRRQALRVEWEALWTDKGVDGPLTPEEMVEWLEQMDDLRMLAKGIRAAQDNACKWEQMLAEHRQRLTSHLADLDSEGHAGERFGELLQRAKQVVDEAISVEVTRKRLEADVGDRQDKLKALRGKSAGAKNELDAWNQRWSKALAELGCRDELSVDQAADRVRITREFFDKRDRVAALEARQIAPMGANTRAFDAEVRAIIDRCATDLIGVATMVAVDTLVTRLEEARLSESERVQLQRQIKETRDQVEELKRRHAAARHVLDQLCALAGVGDPAALVAVEKASDRRMRLMAELEEIDRRLLQVADGTSVDALIAETSGKSSDDLKVAHDELARQIEEGDQQREELSGQMTILQQQAAAIDGSAEATAADQEALGAVGDIFDQAQQFVRLRLAWNLLRRRIEKHRQENQDPMVARASELFAQITCGSFSGLTLDYDDKDEPTIVGVREAGGAPLAVEAFSKGTADQLYLALRLAYVQRQLQAGEPMPLILDDILVDFDDARSEATLRVLAELSKQTQVIMLTHHNHVRELARKALGSDVLKEHML